MEKPLAMLPGQSFLDSHKNITKKNFDFCDAADQGRLMKIINHLRNYLIKFSCFFVGVDVSSHVFPGHTSEEVGPRNCLL